MAAHQAPLSLGFSRREYWSGLPFPSPMYASEKWKCSHSVSRVWLFATPWTAAYQAPPPWDFPGKSTGVGVPLPSPMSYIKSKQLLIFSSKHHFLSSWSIDTTGSMCSEITLQWKNSFRITNLIQWKSSSHLIEEWKINYDTYSAVTMSEIYLYLNIDM